METALYKNKFIIITTHQRAAPGSVSDLVDRQS